MGMKLFPLTTELVEEFKSEQSLRVSTLIPASLVNQAASSFEYAPSWLSPEGLKLCCWPPIYWAACQLMEDDHLRFSILGFDHGDPILKSAPDDGSLLMIHATLRSSLPNQNTPGTILFATAAAQIPDLLFSVSPASSTVPNSVDLSLRISVAPARSEFIPDHHGDLSELPLDNLTPVNKKLLGLQPW